MPRLARLSRPAVRAGSAGSRVSPASWARTARGRATKTATRPRGRAGRRIVGGCAPQKGDPTPAAHTGPALPVTNKDHLWDHP
ncbi:hypothetical protein ACGFNF_13135, partial [Micromonospora sp. NPDC048868]|uniref:hypothetical protein n=1 Tax=Micromonospora sp. NPDC048868 TaxID=3364258 RepID=UPI003720036E